MTLQRPPDPKNNLLLGSLIFISPNVMHRLPHHFANPDQFEPERFPPEKEKALPQYAYMPFGGGLRVCIGNAFAMMEAQLVLATMAQRFRFTLKPNHPVEPNPRITMSAKYGLPMEVHDRGNVETKIKRVTAVESTSAQQLPSNI